VRNTVVAFEYEPLTAEDFRARIRRTTERYPYLVAEEEGRVLGYAYAGPFVGRAAYARSCELTIYLDPAARRRGLGRALYTALEDQLRDMGVLMAEAQAQRFADVYEQSNRMLARSHEPIYLSGYEERQHHDQPISYGLTLNYPLTPRLSLTPGVTYTRLRSDFTQIMRSQQVHQTQKLDYVGIVAGANYRLWDVGRFKCYAAAGVKADLNVATHTETEGVSLHLDKDRLQWSVSGGLGAQYDVIPWLGLYVEPGLSYYPDNGSRIENYFKDKPLNFSLQLGLRLNLK
jgi:GNAT superfamily N-acetyltransferase